MKRTTPLGCFILAGLFLLCNGIIIAVVIADTPGL